MSENILESQLFEIIKNEEMAENIKLAKIDMLIKLGVDVNTSYSAKSALFVAKEKGLSNVCEFLEENGAKEFIDKKKAEELGQELIKECGQEKINFEKVKELINKGADIEAKNNDGKTSLMIASNNGHSEVVKLLLEKGADIEAKNENGRTSLMMASHKGHSEIVKLLLENGANIEAKNVNGETSLMYASSNGNSEVVKLLLEKGADIEAKENDGYTSLMWASHNGHSEVVKLLIEKGADIEAKGSDGKTSLMLASWNRQREVVKVLLEKGANANAKTGSGNTAYDYAYGGSSEIKKMLKEAMKKRNQQNVILNTANKGMGE